MRILLSPQALSYNYCLSYYSSEYEHSAMYGYRGSYMYSYLLPSEDAGKRRTPSQPRNHASFMAAFVVECCGEEQGFGTDKQ